MEKCTLGSGPILISGSDKCQELGFLLFRSLYPILPRFKSLASISPSALSESHRVVNARHFNIQFIQIVAGVCTHTRTRRRSYILR